MTFRRTITAFLAALMSLAMIFGASLSASATPVVVATIPAGNYPHKTVISPDGKSVYAIGVTGVNNELKIINTSTNQVTSSTFMSANNTPLDMAITPDGTKLYVVQYPTSAPFTGKVIVFNLTGNSPVITSQITVGNIASGIAISPNGLKAYVANAGDNTISVIDTTTDTVSSLIPAVTIASGTNTGQHLDYPKQIVVSPDSNTIYVSYYHDQTGANTGVAALVSFNVNPQANPSNVLLNSIEFGTPTDGIHPDGLALSSDGRYLFLTNSASTSKWIKKFDLQAQADFTSSTQVTPGSQSQYLALSADDTVLYSSQFGMKLEIFRSSDLVSTTTLTLDGANPTRYTGMIAPSPNASSHFAYVGGFANVYLIGEYLSQNWQELSGNTGTTLTSAALTASGISGTVTYSIAPALPTGFTLNTSTGVVSGSSSTPLSATTYTITGTNGTTSAVATVSITVTDPSSSGGSGSNQLANTGNKSQLPIALIGLMFVLAGISVYSGSIALSRRANTR